MRIFLWLLWRYNATCFSSSLSCLCPIGRCDDMPEPFQFVSCRFVCQFLLWSRDCLPMSSFPSRCLLCLSLQMCRMIELTSAARILRSSSCSPSVDIFRILHIFPYSNVMMVFAETIVEVAAWWSVEREQNIAPSTEPWGTPDVHGTADDVCLLTSELVADVAIMVDLMWLQSLTSALSESFCSPELVEVVGPLDTNSLVIAGIPWVDSSDNKWVCTDAER